MKKVGKIGLGTYYILVYYIVSRKLMKIMTMILDDVHSFRGVEGRKGKGIG